MPVSGDGRHLWLAAPATTLPGRAPGAVVELLHADGTDAEPAWERVTRLRGRVAAMAAPGGGTRGPGTTDYLWLVFDGGAVVRVSLTPGSLEDQWFFSTRPVTNLPMELQVIAATAAGDALWVLGQARSPVVASGFDVVPPRFAGVDGGDVATESAELLNLVLGLPRPLGVEGPPAVSDPSPTTKPDNAAGDEGSTAITELLLVYRGGRWQRVPLPVSPATPSVAVLVPPASDAADARPTRIVRTRVDDKSVVMMTTPVVDGGWEQTALDLESSGMVRGLRVDGQLVVAWQSSLMPAVVRAAVVRGASLAPLGEMVVDPETPGDDTAAAWTAVPMAGGVGVVAGPARAGAAVASHLAGRTDRQPPALTLGVMDLRGRVIRPPAEVGLEPDRPFAEAADFLLMLTAVVGATLLLFSFWRRDPQANRPRLPQGMVVADLWRRAAGGAIDLAIGGAVVGSAMGLSAEDLVSRWPGRGRGDPLEFIVPGLLFIGLTVLHTTVTELLTARSAGKALMGTRLAGLSGQRPTTGQVVVRGLLKPFDLIAYLLLVLPVVNPGRQRLADLIARTLVVRKAAEHDSDATPGGADRG